MWQFPKHLEKYKVGVPEGKSGDWKITKFVVSDEESKWDRVRGTFKPGHRFCYPGNYTRLSYKGHVIMSDTADEIQDHYPLFWNSKGKVLLNGLGLGVALQGVLLHPQVEFVTVIEISQDVVDLTKDYHEALFPGRFEIIVADALEYKPPKGVRYNTVWHDIWPTICSDNLEEMKHLHRKYGRKTDWQASWGRELCEYQGRIGY